MLPFSVFQKPDLYANHVKRRRMRYKRNVFATWRLTAAGPRGPVDTAEYKPLSLESDS
jgi:hypothetical protein